MGKCSWSGDDSEVCKCHRCKKPKTDISKELAELCVHQAERETAKLDAVGVDTHSHVGKLSIPKDSREWESITDDNGKKHLLDLHPLTDIMKAQPLDAVGVDTNSHVGKMSIMQPQDAWPDINKMIDDVSIPTKLDYSLIPIEALEELALAYTIGAKKHKHRPDVDPTTDDEEFAAIMRHLVAYRRGEERDPEGHHHLAAVAARCFKLIARSNRGRKTKVVAGDN